MNNQLNQSSETYKIIGACFKVHSELGNGFLEKVYHEALTIEFERNGVLYKNEEPIKIHYLDQVLQSSFYADFLCYDNIIVEIKAVKKLDNQHLAQIMNYLAATKCKLGLLINFGSPSLEYKRVIR
jgi:GxxExxY protein